MTGGSSNKLFKFLYSCKMLQCFLILYIYTYIHTAIGQSLVDDQEVHKLFPLFKEVERKRG